MSRGLSKKRAELLAQISRELRQVGAQDVSLRQVVAERAAMNSTDLDCLSLISKAVALTAGRLAELTGLTTGAITGVIDRLEKSGYVQRTQDLEDRRRVFVSVVDERLHELDRLCQPLQRSLGEAVSDYSDEQLALVADFLARLSPVIQGEIARLRQEAQPATRSTLNEYSSSVAGVSRGRLIFARGASQVTVSGDPALSDLFQANFSGTAPGVWAEGGNVKVLQKHNFLRGPAPAEIKLNTAIPWQLTFQGANKVVCNLQELRISSIELNIGASEVLLRLPRPVSTVPVRLLGGVNQVTISRPLDSAARVQINGPASQVQIEQEHTVAVAGGLRWETPNYAHARDRYDIIVSGVSNQLIIESH